MIIPAPDISDWIERSGGALISAWTLEIEAALSWDRPFAEVFAGELHAAMLTTLRRGGSEREFLGLINRSNTGLERVIERNIADLFYTVGLTLARAAMRNEAFPTARMITHVKSLDAFEAVYAVHRPTVRADPKPQPKLTPEQYREICDLFGIE